MQVMLQNNYSSNEQDFDHLIPILECLQGLLARSSQKIITLPLWEDAVKRCTIIEGSIKNDKMTTTTTSGGTKNTKQTTLHDMLGNPNRDEEIIQDDVYMETREETLTRRMKQPTPAVDWKVIDAFDTPTLIYDSLRQQFAYGDKSSGRPSLFGTVEDRIEMLSQRFLRVQQRVSRSVSHLTTIDRLLGTSVTSSQRLLGLLHANSTSSTLAEAKGIVATAFELEDLTGSLQLHILSNARLDTRGIYTDGCIVLVEGYYEDGCFNVHTIKLPPIESKALSKPYIPPLPGGFTGNHSTASMSIYTMVNVAVDEPIMMTELKRLVDRLISLEESEQVLLVLMGNFTTGSTMSLSVALEEICRILKPLPSNHEVFIMSGPNDTPSMCWPIPAIKAPSSFSHELNAKVHFVSNPCRLHYDNHHEVLLYRQDMIQHHLQNEILSARSSTRETVKSRILHSILSQGHLLPKAPTYWNYDSALSLYPLPDLILVGLEEGEDCVRSFFEGECQIVAPGSQGNWAKVTLRTKRKRSVVPTPMAVEFLRNEEEDENSLPGED